MSTVPMARSPALTSASAPDGVARRVGGVAEFLLVGGLTPILFVVSLFLRRTLGLDAADYAVGFTMFYGAYVVNDPHFAVTYLLFYRDARGRAFGDAFGGWQRVRYVVAGVVVSDASAPQPGRSETVASLREVADLVLWSPDETLVDDLCDMLG